MCSVAEAFGGEPMSQRFLVLVTPVLLLAGCNVVCSRGAGVPPSQYRAPGFDPARLTRVLVLSLGNETAYPCAGEDVRTALADALQTAGRFEVVVPPPDVVAAQSALLHVGGHFDEAELLALCRTFEADAVLLGAVTQFQPYVPQRIGLSLQLINPAQAVVCASINGLWDARDLAAAEAAPPFYVKIFRYCAEPEFGDTVLESPRLYQRNVCRQVVQALLGP